MMERVHALAGQARLFEEAPSSELLLNSHLSTEMHPWLLVARELLVWPSCLNDGDKLAPTGDVPDNSLPPEPLARGVLSAFPGR